MATENAVCKECGKAEIIKLTEEGYLPDPYDLADLGWYWSNNDNCWYCKPCERNLVSKMLRELMGLCKENKIPVHDLKGNLIQE